jgi:hypothetical protein
MYHIAYLWYYFYPYLTMHYYFIFSLVLYLMGNLLINISNNDNLSMKNVFFSQTFNDLLSRKYLSFPIYLLRNSTYID